MLPLRAENPEQEKILVSWKEIASFLDRAERTVRRWERDRGLPVHRVPGGERGGVYAYPSELTNWLKGKSSELDEDDSAPEYSAVGDQAETQGASAESASVHLPARTPRHVTLARIAAWLAPLALTAALIYYLSGTHSASRATTVGGHGQPNLRGQDLAPDAIAVLPFTNAGGDPTAEYLSDGITESLIGNLAHIPQLKVRSRDAAFRFKGKGIGAQEAGKELGVSVVVGGRVAVRGSNIEISADLTDVHDNTEIWGKQYTGKISGLIQLQKQISGDVAETLRSTLSAAEIEQVARQGTQDPEAYNLYLKGRYAWNLRYRAKLEAAISFFKQAIEKDPEYALAYAGLADVYSVMPNFGGNPNEDFPKSNAAARKALELDPTLAHPHAVLGSNEVEYDWDFAGGEAEFRKAIALDPNDATAHQWYAEAIGQLGRHTEALAEINRAHELDPLSPIITRVLGGTLLDDGQYDRSIEVCKQLVRENPSLPIGHDCLFFGYWVKHMYPQAIEEWKIEGQLTGDPDDIQLAEAMDRGYSSAGWKGALAGAVAVTEARRKNGYASPFFIARWYADMGDKNKAFEWLDTAYREHDRLLIGLNVSPGFDKIRSDFRFAELAHRVGLPKPQ